MEQNELELLDAITPALADLMARHRARRDHWYAHEIVPWEQGRNYRTEPWDESQCSLSPEARTSLILNLLTEDNLPYYHLEIEKNMAHNEVVKEWNHLWTAEEGQHAIAIRSYLLTSRNCDPIELEDDRVATMEAGFESAHSGPVAGFVYTTAQELATRVSHRNAGKVTDDETAYELMGRIATDENHHFMFYRGAVTAMLDQAPETVLPSILEVFKGFKMPGTGIPGFRRRAVAMARAGVYNMRIHHERVIQPLLRDWNIGSITGLAPDAAKVQQELMDFARESEHRAERFEARG